MALNKKNEFEESMCNLAEFAKAISHPARISILHAIAKRKECICGEILEDLPLAQSTVSQHLKKLKSTGLIQGEVEGLKSCYCINWKKLDEMNNLLNDFYKKMNKYRKNSKMECY